MQVEEAKLYNLLNDNDVSFLIPLFQRPYVWNKDSHVKTLLDDLENLLRNKIRRHFIGTIVYKEDQHEDKQGLTNYIIIDGQQRITTFYLFIKALHDSLNSEDFSYAQKLESDFLRNEIVYIRGRDSNIENNNPLKLKMTPSDNRELNNLMNFPERTNKDSSLYQNYQVIKSRIKKWLDEGITPFDIETTLKKLYYVKFELKEEDDAQRIFASINSTGKELSHSDLIRNLFLLNESEMEFLYNNYWSAIEKLLDRETNETLLDDFLKHFLEARLGKFVNKKDIYSNFTSLIDNGIDSIELLKEVYNHAKYYNAFIHPKDSLYSETVKDLLNYIKLIKLKTVYPFLLHVFNDYENNQITEETLEKVLKLILSYLVRRQISSNTTKGFNKFFTQLYSRINNQDANLDYYSRLEKTFLEESTNSSSHFPNNKETIENLEAAQLYNLSALLPVLIALENSGHEKIDYSKLTVEHIMPQTMTPEWKKMINVSDEEYRPYLHTLGNLTLISRNNNSKLNNKSYLDKRKIFLEASKTNTLNKEINENTVWNLEIIRKRTKRLSELFIKVFPDLTRPEEPQVNESYNENTSITKSKPPRKVSKEKKNHLIERTINIRNEKIDFTYGKLNYLLFNGEKFNIKSNAELLRTIVLKLYEENPEVIEDFARHEFKQSNWRRPLLSSDPNTLISSKKVNDNIYVNTNYSNNRTIEKINYLLDSLNNSAEIILNGYFLP